MRVIERAEQRLNDEIRQHELGLDNVDDIQYWAAYLDGARAQKKDAAAAIEDLQAEVAFYKKRVCESCGVCPDDMSDPNNCEIAGHGMWVGVNPLVDSVQCSICGGMLYSKELETPYCPYCGAKMEVQDGK